MPYIIWNSLFLFIYYIWKIIAGENDELSQLTFTNIFFSSKEGYPINYPLWFIRDLFLMVIIAPFIHLLVRIKYFAIIVFFVLSCIFLVQDKLNFHNLFSGMFTAFYFFSLGSFFGFHKINFVSIFEKIAKFTAIIWATILFYRLNTLTFPWSFTSTDRILIILGLISIIGYSAKIPFISLKKNTLNYLNLLGNSSFYIFCSHAFFIPIVSKGITPFIHLNILPEYFFKIFIVTITCISSFMILKRYCLKTLKLLAGGRL